MSPLHVLISASTQDEEAYGTAFAGAIDLYCFASNVEAFERLTSVRQPVDVIVITSTQEALFNMTAAQLAQRLVSPPLAESTNLRNTQIVVVGTEAPGHMRVHRAGSMHAAIRLIKFGEVESAPMPTYDMEIPVQAPASIPTYSLDTSGFAPTFGQPYAEPATMRPASSMGHYGTSGTHHYGQFHQEPAPASSSFFDSVVSSIWNAPESHEKRRTPRPEPIPAKPDAGPSLPPGSQGPRDLPVQRIQMPRGTGRKRTQQRGGQSLFAKNVEMAQATSSAPIVVHDTASEDYDRYVRELQANRPFNLPGKGVYRGPVPRKGSYEKVGPSDEPAPLPTPGVPTSPHAQHAVSAHPQQPSISPQLAEQIKQLTYPPNVISDPVMGWSSAVQKQLSENPAPAPLAAPLPGGYGQMPMPAAHYPVAMPEHFAPMESLMPAMDHNNMTYDPQPKRGRSKKSRLARIRDKVVEGERAPMAPNIPAGGGYPPYNGMPQAPMPQQPMPMQMAHPVNHSQQAPVHHAPGHPSTSTGTGAFETPDHLLRRADGDVSFG